MSLFVFLFGIVIGGLFFWILYRLKKGSFESMASEILHKAHLDIENRRAAFELSLKEREFASKLEIEKHLDESRRKHAAEDLRFKEREERLDTKWALFEQRVADLEKKETKAEEKSAELLAQLHKLAQKEHALEEALKTASRMTEEEAKALLLKKMESELGEATIRHFEEAKAESERRATTLLTEAMNRLSAPSILEHTVTTVALPSDEMKGRIIGREGRNIRLLEQLTGANFLVDDTPGAIVISSFDPIRKHIAKTALSDLIADGRIHPTRIEEVVEKAFASIDRKIEEAGVEAINRAKIGSLHPALKKLLGKLKFSHVLGQNCLEHSIEVSNLLGIMCAELGLNEALGRRIGLLHDIGKAAPEHTLGSHALIGHAIALQYGEKEEVACGIGCHHDEMPPTTLEGSLCATANALSGLRLGARHEPIEQSIKRLRKLEQLCQSEGVERAFVLQAGREVRVIVSPDKIEENQMVLFARQLVKKIEKEMSFPGKIKVTVSRESKITEYAS